MPCFSLRTLLILLALLPPLMAICYWRWVEYHAAHERKAALREVARRLLVGEGWSNLERMARNRPTDSELEQIVARSAELGAPQPIPLPLGYGETPNEE